MTRKLKRSRYKVLRVRPPMFDDTKEFDDCYLRISPIFNRDGYYFDRKLDLTWIEYKGLAWNTSDKSYFLHTLDQLNHLPLRDGERRAIEYIISTKIPLKNIKKLFSIDTQWRYVRILKRNVSKYLKRT